MASMWFVASLALSLELRRAAPRLCTQRALARSRVPLAQEEGKPTAQAAELFAGMKQPAPLDSPEGAEALARMQKGTGEDGNADQKQTKKKGFFGFGGGGDEKSAGAPPGPPTALAADVFAELQTPVSLDSPEGAAALKRMKEGAATADGAPSLELAAPSPPTTADGAPSLELASPSPPTTADGAPSLDLAVPGPAAPPPAAPTPAAMGSNQYPENMNVIDDDEVATKTLSQLYPMPVLPSDSSLPFGIQPIAFAISSGVVVAVLVLLGYLSYLLSTQG